MSWRSLFLLSALPMLVVGFFKMQERVLDRYIVGPHVDPTHQRPRILVFASTRTGNELGEEEWAQKLLIAGKRLGMDVSILRYAPPKLISKKIDKWFLGQNPVQRAVDRHQPDAIIQLQYNLPLFEKHANYVALTHGDDFLLSIPDWDYDILRKMRGALIVAEDLPKIRQWTEENGLPFHTIPWYPAAVATPYQEPTPDKLFYCGANWDNKRKMLAHSGLGEKLNSSNWVDIYGLAKAWAHTPDVYRGLIPADGQSFVQKISESGAVLIMHSQGHIDTKIPSGRIFEAAAASAVTISDRNPWIEKEFGDSVLYIDSSGDGLDLFNDVEKQMQWVWAHPEEAKSKAKRANAIFNEKFTAEHQLEAFWNFHLSLQ